MVAYFIKDLKNEIRGLVTGGLRKRYVDRVLGIVTEYLDIHVLYKSTPEGIHCRGVS